MGELKNKRIVQSRVFMDGHDMSLPNYDYEFTYPVTVYDAVKKTMDDNSATLTDELEAIYNLLRSKQPLIEAGKPGRIMTWSGVQGDIGSLDVARSIDKNPVNRSHSKIPTERAVGEQLDLKASVSDLHNHIQSRSIHITDVERAKWNSQISAATFNSHVSNTRMHISDAERRAWNAKADVDIVEDHVNNFNNPHNVTAHQAGTYTREEIDAAFKSLRETFFNYVNIAYDDRTGVATVHSYDPNNWNPNYVLSFSQALPDVLDTTATYFAIRPATDYKVNETADVVIYRKAPGLSWLEVGSATMKAGDMFIVFPSTAMYVWMQGRFIQVFADAAADEDNLHGNIWYPKLDDKCELSWVLSKETTPPTPKIIKGADGYTPIKGVDYVDGKDGEGVPAGGVTGEFLTKQSDTNYDTAWKSPEDIFTDFVASGKLLPKGLVRYSDIEGAPKAYTGLGENDDGYITQAGVTKEFQRYDNDIIDLHAKVDGPAGSVQTRADLFNHINDYNNPHRVTAEQIGSVSIVTYNNHITDFNNPHNVSAAQIGLDHVDNTSDADKPISAQTQLALDRITTQINQINDGLDGSKYISSAEWDPIKSAIIFARRDGNKVELVLPITDTFGKITFDSATSELVIPLPDGTKNRINISSMIRVYNGSTSENIQVTVGDDKVIRATVIPGTIGEFEIAPNVNLRESPTTTTQAVSDRTTKIATTEYVKNQVINNLISYDTDRPLSANMGRVLNQMKADTKDVIALINDIELTRVIDSLESLDPAAALSANMGRHLDLIKAPRVHTSPSGSTYGQATADLFGHVRASEIDPLMDGVVWQGTDDGRYARADHRHPTDITRAPLDSPHLTGEPTTPTPPDDSNDQRIANTEWIRKNIIGTAWGVCNTESEVADKVAKLSDPENSSINFILKTGVLVVIKFKNANMANNARLNVNDSGWRPIIYKDRPVGETMIDANTDHGFIYDGSSWRLVNPAATGLEIFDGSISGVNQMTGYIGFTTEGFGGDGINFDGQVNRALISIPYKSRKDSTVKVTVSNDPDDWALRFGDNSLIPVKDPMVVSVGKSAAVVQFTLTESYPSNTPCTLVIRRKEASIRIESTNEKPLFVPVTSIGGIPSSVPSGSRLSLSQFYALPINSTNQTISWRIGNAGTTDASISGDVLIINKCGIVVIEGTVVNGKSETTNFVQNVSIKSIADVIQITRQPETFKEVAYGEITEKSIIVASSGNNELSYQWYQSPSNDTTNGTPISGQNTSTFTIPKTLAVGSYYFYCEIKVTNDPNGLKQNTSILQVNVIKPVKSVRIKDKPEFMLEFSTRIMQADIQPTDATHKSVTWKSSNRDVAIIDNNGVLYTYAAGNTTIRAEIDGKYDELELEVRKMINVSRITNIPDEMESSSTITLSPTVEPANATYRNVIWSIIAKNGNNVTLSGNSLTASGSGKITIRATINGKNDYVYMQDFNINLTAEFVNVTDVNLPTTITWQKTPLHLNRSITPTNASRQTVVWSIINDGGTNATLKNDVIVADNVGTVDIRATIKNGLKTSDYHKDFSITIKEKSPSITDIAVENVSRFGLRKENKVKLIVYPQKAKPYYIVSYKLTGLNTDQIRLNNDKIEANIDSYDDIIFFIEITAVDNNNPKNIWTKLEKVILLKNKAVISNLELNAASVFGSHKLYRNNIVYSLDPQTDIPVTWTIENDGGTGATIVGNTIKATQGGTIIIKGTVKDGISIGHDYSKTFNVNILQNDPTITKIEGIPTYMFLGNKWSVSQINVTPADELTTSLIEGYIDQDTDTVGTIMESGPRTLATFVPQRVGVMGVRLKWYNLNIEKNIQIRVWDKNTMTYITDVDIMHSNFIRNKNSVTDTNKYMAITGVTFTPLATPFDQDMVEYTIKQVMNKRTSANITTSAELIDYDSTNMSFTGVTTASKLIKLKNTGILVGDKIDIILEAKVVNGKSDTEDYVKTITLTDVEVKG